MQQLVFLYYFIQIFFTPFCNLNYWWNLSPTRSWEWDNRRRYWPFAELSLLCFVYVTQRMKRERTWSSGVNFEFCILSISDFAQLIWHLHCNLSTLISSFKFYIETVSKMLIVFYICRSFHLYLKNLTASMSWPPFSMLYHMSKWQCKVWCCL